MIQLTPRLQAVAAMHETGNIIADIGTDHAYIPAYLMQQGSIQEAYACDINEGPLQNAAKTVKKEKLDGITFLLSDGLQALQGKDLDEVFIAGMGGELIVSILDRAPWCRDEKLLFILQPMTKADVLRRYLYGSGFIILQETLAQERNKLYNIMKVVYCGKPCEVSDAFALLGRADRDPLFEQKRQREIRRLKRICDSLKNKIDAAQEREQLLALIREIEVYPC